MSEYEVKKKKLTIELLSSMLLNELLQRGNFVIHVKDGGLCLPVKVTGNNCELYDTTSAMIFLKNTSSHIAGKMAEMNNIPYKNMDFMHMSAATARAVLNTLSIERRLHLKTPIKTFAFKSDSSMAFCRIPFDPSPSVMACPVWDGFLENFTNIDAVKMWVGSLFFENSDRSQYLWMYGKGGNGKSTFAKIIREMLGGFARTEQAPVSNSEMQFWSYGLLGKRLIILDDCVKRDFVTTGLFKSASGSSSIRVEQKGCQAYDTSLDCKFLFTSNVVPFVSTDAADQRRLILSTAKNIKQFDFDPEFEPSLRRELGAFVSNCMLLYKERCGDGRPIPTDNVEALEIGNIYHEEIDAWFNEYFELDTESHVKVNTFHEERKQARLDFTRVNKYLDDVGIKKKLVRQDGQVFRALEGVKQKITRIYGSHEGKF